MEHKKKLEEAFLDVIAKHSATIPFPVFLAALLMAVSASMSPRLTYLVPSLWVLAVFIVLVIRWYFLRDIMTSKHVSKEHRMTLVVGLSLLNGLVHASSMLFFNQLDSPERAVQTLLLLGVSVGAIASTSGHRQIFYAFAVPVFISLFLSWGVFGVDRTPEDTIDEQFYRYAIPIFLLMFLMVLSSLAKNYSKMFTESFNMRSHEKAMNKKLTGLNGLLTQALEETTEANASKTRFLAAASHDLRQPIHTLTFSSTALSLQNLDDESRRISQNMDKAIQALSKQMDSLLDISKLDAGVVELELEMFSLHDYLNQVHINYLPQMQTKNLEFTLDLPKDKESFYVETDYVQFGRIVNNLLNNALKHTVSGCIHIEVKKINGNAYLSIVDTGEGISEDDQQKIFDEFYQVKNPQRSSKEGLGLGLSIVKRLTKLLDIRLQLHSTLEEGTSVTLEIPLKNNPIEEGEEQAASSPAPPINILCVDDDEQILEALRTVFEAIGYGVYLASGTASAMEMIKHREPDILLADLRLEGTDSGFTTIRSVREALPGLPAFLITGNIDPESLKAARDVDVEMLHKPLDPKFLLQKIQSTLGL